MTRMTPSEAFVETLVAHGVTEIFGIMGSAFMDAMDIFEPAGIRFVPVVHEQGAAHMADGYARVSGRHGVCTGQNGPGVSNCVTAIAAAYWAHSPVVIITPETGSLGIGLGGFQEANQLPMFQEFTKYQGHVNSPTRIAEYTGRCFDRAHSELGPTQLNIPRDKYYIHCDGALFAMMLPFLDQKNILTIDFNLPIDSISISGHKFLGTPMPCGIIITRKYLMKKINNPIEYLNSVDNTITGSRNGHSSLYIWNVIKNKGVEGFKNDVKKTMENAKYIEKELQQRNISSYRNNLSSTIIFERPNEHIVQKWQLAVIGDIAHIVVMPSVTKDKLNLFLKDLEDVYVTEKKCLKKYMSHYCKCQSCKE